MQRHGVQHGTFHVVTRAAHGEWCTLPNAPEIIIDNVCMTRNMHGARVHAFCFLPDHMHIVVVPGEKGLSRFLQSLKSNAIKDILSRRDAALRLRKMGDLVSPGKKVFTTSVSMIRANGRPCWTTFRATP
jgi:REP element-mobilizing transposase RayT